MIKKLRERLKDIDLRVWGNEELQGFLDKNDQDEHGVIAECMEDLAANPEKARRWDPEGVKYTHYDLMKMAEYHRRLQQI